MKVGGGGYGGATSRRFSKIQPYFLQSDALCHSSSFMTFQWEIFLVNMKCALKNLRCGRDILFYKVLEEGTPRTIYQNDTPFHSRNFLKSEVKVQKEYDRK